MERTPNPRPTVARSRRQSGTLLADREWRAHAALGALLRELRALRSEGIAALEVETSEGGDARRLLAVLRARGPLPLCELPGTWPATEQPMRALAERLAAHGLVELIPNPRTPRAPVVRLTSRGEHYLLDAGLPGVAGLLPRLRDLSADQLENAVRVIHRLRRASRDD